MSVRVHEWLLNSLFVLMMSAGFLLVDVALRLVFGEPVSKPLLIGAAASLVTVPLFLAVRNWVPVRCPRRGCNWPMRRTWVKLQDGSKFRLVCPICGEFYDTIFGGGHDSTRPPKELGLSMRQFAPLTALPSRSIMY